MEELQQTTQRVNPAIYRIDDRASLYSHQVTTHIRRIEAVEKDLKALRDTSASKDDISRIRAEMKKLYDGLHVGKWE